MTDDTRAPARVQIVDVKIPMDSMVWLLVKLTIAAIPAALILIVIGAVVAGAIRAI